MMYLNLTQKWPSLEKFFDRSIKRMVCFDISHEAGNHTIGSCVAVGPDGALFKEYRFFNIEDVTPGDDYQAIFQALLKRFHRMHELNDLPDIIFIDGGLGQVRVALKALEFKLQEWQETTGKEVLIIGISKGKERIWGNEVFIDAISEETLAITKDLAFFTIITQLRDEAHRYANKKRQERSQKHQHKSGLENLSGIGKATAQKLLEHFQGGKNFYNASLEDLLAVKGISRKVAERIYEQLEEMRVNK